MSQTLDSPFEMLSQYLLRYQPKVLTNLGFGIWPKLGFPRDQKVFLSHCPFVPGQKKFPCPAVPLSRGTRKSCPVGNPSLNPNGGFGLTLLQGLLYRWTEHSIQPISTGGGSL